MFWGTFALFFFACCGAAATGALFPPGDWYRRLNKPPWTPPDWVFPTVWTILYIAISYAAALVAFVPGNGIAMGFWAMQIAFNGLWSPVFFGLQRIRAGMWIVSILWVAVLGTMVSFYVLDSTAGLLIAPYLLWVTIASALNFSVLRRNPDAAAA